MFRQGISLKDLLQNPELLAGPPKAAINQNQFNLLKKPEVTITPTAPVKTEAVKVVKNDIPDDPYLGQLAFLGPNIWDTKTPSNNADAFGVEYMGFDEFLIGDTQIEDNLIDNAALERLLGNPTTDALTLSPQLSPGPSSPQHLPSPPAQGLSELQKHLVAQLSPQIVSPSTPISSKVQVHLSSSSDSGAESVTVEVEDCPLPEAGEFSENDIMLATAPGERFDPTKRTFTEDELRPQPMIRKSRKQYVSANDKDDKYWNKRNKNNVAAKRSRDARRIKENQIALRATFLERGNQQLRDDLDQAKKENDQLRLRLAKYEQL